MGRPLARQVSPPRKASPDQIISIREEWDAGCLSVRGWADELGCSLETVRRIARRDTNRLVRAGQSIEGTHARGSARPADPTDQEVAASLARLQSSLGSAPQTGQGVNSLLDELTQKGQS